MHASTARSAAAETRPGGAEESPALLDARQELCAKRPQQGSKLGKAAGYGLRLGMDKSPIQTGGLF